jgi:hypothetical protein
VAFFVALALLALPVGPLLVMGLGSFGDSPDETALRLFCWGCLALAALGLLLVPALAYPTTDPRAEQLWLERAGILLLLGWAAYATFSSDRTPQAAWMSAVTLGLILFALVPLITGFLGLGEAVATLFKSVNFRPVLRREGWALTLWLLSVPVGVSVGATLGGVRERLAGRGRRAADVGMAFQVGAALAAVAAPVVLRAIRPDVTVGFACCGPGPTSAFAGWLLTSGLGLNVAAAAAFLFPVKLLLLTLPLAAGGVLAGVVAARKGHREEAS